METKFKIGDKVALRQDPRIICTVVEIYKNDITVSYDNKVYNFMFADDFVAVGELTEVLYGD